MRQSVRGDKVHSSSNGPGRARLLLKTITIQIFGPVGPKMEPTGSKIYTVIVIGPDSAEAGLLLLLSSFRYVAWDRFSTVRSGRANIGQKPAAEARPGGPNVQWQVDGLYVAVLWEGILDLLRVGNL